MKVPPIKIGNILGMDDVVCDYCDIQSYKEKSFQTLSIYIYIYIYYPIEVGYYNRITATYNLCIGELL